jgi:hypothetical protein
LIFEAEPLDGGEDVVGGFCPSEWLGIGVVHVDEAGDCGVEGIKAAVDAAPDLLLGEERKKAFDLIDPRGAGWGKVGMPQESGQRGRLTSQSRMILVLWVA